MFLLVLLSRNIKTRNVPFINPDNEDDDEEEDPVRSGGAAVTDMPPPPMSP